LNIDKDTMMTEVEEIPENSYVVMPKGSELKELLDGRCIIIAPDKAPVIVGKNSIIHSEEHLETQETE